MLRQRAGRRTVHVKATPDGVFEGVEPLRWWRQGGGVEDVPADVLGALASPDVVVSRAAGLDMRLAVVLDWLRTRAGEEGPVLPAASALARSNASLYIEYTSLADWLPELEAHAPPLPIEAELRRESGNVWIGDGATLGKLHFDASEGLLSPVSGRKRAVLVPPYANELIGEGHLREGVLSGAGWSEARASAPSLARGELSDATSIVHAALDLASPPEECKDAAAVAADAGLRRLCPSAPGNAAAAAALWASRVECDVGPGETLYIPPHWWHEVASEAGPMPGGGRASIAVNAWSRPVVDKAFPCGRKERCALGLNIADYGGVL